MLEKESEKDKLVIKFKVSEDKLFLVVELVARLMEKTGVYNYTANIPLPFEFLARH